MQAVVSSLRDAVRPLRCPAITLRSWLATSVAYLRQASLIVHCSQYPVRDNTRVLALASVPTGRAASHQAEGRNGWGLGNTHAMPAVGRRHLRACVNIIWWMQAVVSSLRDAVRPLRCPAITLRSWLATFVAYLRQASLTVHSPIVHFFIEKRW